MITEADRQLAADVDVVLRTRNEVLRFRGSRPDVEPDRLRPRPVPAEVGLHDSATSRISGRLGSLVDAVSALPGTELGFLLAGYGAAYGARLVAVPPGPEQDLLRRLELWNSGAPWAVFSGPASGPVSGPVSGPAGGPVGGRREVYVRSTKALDPGRLAPDCADGARPDEVTGADRYVLASLDGGLAAVLDHARTPAYTPRAPVVSMYALVAILRR